MSYSKWSWIWRSFSSIHKNTSSTARLLSDSAKVKQKQSAPNYSDIHSRLTDLEKALSKRMKKAGFQRSKRFYGGVVSSVIICFGGYLYLFPHKLRQQVVDEVSTVASQSLEDEKIVSKAGQLSKDVLADILNDENTKAVSSDFVKGIIVSEPIREAAISTILDLLNDPRVLDLLRIRLSTIILGILQNDSTRDIVMSQVNSIIQHESVRRSLQILLEDLTKTPEVQSMMSDFFRDVLDSDTVKNQGIALGQRVTADVISDKGIQERAGKAIWSAVKYSFVPSIFYGQGSVPESGSSNSESAPNDVPIKKNTEMQSDDSKDASKILSNKNSERLNRYDD